MGADGLKGCSARGEAQRLVTELFQRLRSETHQRLLVVHDQHALAFAARQRRGLIRRPLRRVAASSQVHGEGGALPALGRDVDRAVDARHDAVHQRQAEAGADADLLGAEERIEHALEDVIRNASARVAHREHDVLAGLDRADGCRPRRVAARRLERDAQHAALRHRLPGVRGKVHHYLMHLGGIAEHRRVPRAHSRHDGHVRGETRGDLVERLAHDRLDVHREALADAAPAEREDAVDERAAALAGGHHAVQVAAQARALLRIAHRHLAVAEDRAEDIVEVVRDAAGERADRLQALRAAQLLLHLAQLLLGLLPLRDVLHEADHARGVAHGVEKHAPARLQPVHRAVRMDHAVFGGDLTRTVRVAQRVLDRGPVLRMHALLPRFESPVVGAGCEAVHRLEVGRPAVLALALPDLPFEGDGARRLLRELEHFLARAQFFLDAFALRDVARAAVIALEATLLIEDRRAARAVVADLAVRPRAAVFEIAERPARREIGLVLGPRGGQVRGIARKLPARLAVLLVLVVAGDVRRERRRHIPQVLVLHPEAVRIQLHQSAEARLALAQGVDSPFALGYVADDADDPLRHAVPVAVDFPPGAEPAQLLLLPTQDAVLEFVV